MDNDTATTQDVPGWFFCVAGTEEGLGIVFGDADDLAPALEGAWRLNRSTEATINVYDNRDSAGPRLVATVAVTWIDE